MFPATYTYIYTVLVTVRRVLVEERGSLAKVPNVYYISSCREESVGRGGEEEILNYRISTWITTTVRWTRGKEGGREGGREREGAKKDNRKQRIWETRDGE